MIRAPEWWVEGGTCASPTCGVETPSAFGSAPLRGVREWRGLYRSTGASEARTGIGPMCALGTLMGVCPGWIVTERGSGSHPDGTATPFMCRHATRGRYVDRWT